MFFSHLKLCVKNENGYIIYFVQYINLHYTITYIYDILIYSLNKFIHL